MNITYRKLELTDIDKLVELRKLQLRDEGEQATCDLTEPLADFYKRHLSDGTFVSWVAVDNEEIVATSGVSFTEKPPYYGNPTGKIGIVSNMYTIPSYRRKGIAKRLLELVVDEARHYRCGVIHITASELGSYLYQDFGFIKNANFFQYKLN